MVVVAPGSAGQRFDTLGRLGDVLHDERHCEGIFYRYDAVELHHMLKTMDGSLAEITQTLQQKASKTIHINPASMPSGIDRGIFAKWRRAYWQGQG